MTNPSKNSEQVNKVVNAAAQLFARQGYHGTSTREIARLADISENTLFRYFEHKEDLFWVALRSRLSALELRRDLLAGLADGASPEVVLPQIFTQLVDTAILKPELLRLIAVAFIELSWKAPSVCYEYLSPIFSAVNSYLTRNIESGKLRNVKLRQVGHFLTTQGIGTAARLLCGFLCVRLLAVSQYAEFAVVYSFLGTLAILMNVSFSETLAPLVGEKTDDLQLIADYTASLRQLAHWIFFAIAPAAVLLYPLVVHKQNWSWEVIAGMLAILLTAAWCDRLRGTYGAVLIVRRDQRTWNKAEMFASFVPLTIVVILWATKVLNAFSAMLASLATAVCLGTFYFFRARRLLRTKGRPSKQKRREIVHLALPNMPTIIFYAFQGQVSLFLITFFGHSTAVASVGALNRLSQVYILFGLVNPNLISPYFARLPEARVKRNYFGVLAIEAALALLITGLARAFPQIFLWVLGHNYSGLKYEVFLAIAAASIAFLNGAMSFIHNARRFIYWWNTAATIILTVVVEVIFIWKVDLSTVRGVLYLSLAVLGLNFLINALTGVYGFVCGPRQMPQPEPITAGAIEI